MSIHQKIDSRCLDFWAQYIKYREQNKILSDFWNDVKGKTSQLLIDKWYAVKKYQNIEEYPDELVVKFKQLIESIDMEEKSLLNPIYLEKKDVKRLIWGKNAILRNNLLAEAIISYLSMHNYKPLFVIDGLDNIDYYRYEDYYLNILAQVRSFSLRDDKQNRYNSKVIVSLRDETYETLKSLALNFFKNSQPPIYRIKPNDIEKVILTKVNIALNPTCDYFKIRKKKAVSKIKQAMKDDRSNHKTDKKNRVYDPTITTNNDFDPFTNSFLNQMITAIKKVIPNNYSKKEINITYIFNTIYNYNLRAFLSNFLNIYKFHRLFREKKQYISEGRNYVFTEGQLLNGHLFLDTNVSPFEFGKCIPNIFYFNCIKHVNKWHGLCLLRMLQLLKREKHEEQLLYNQTIELFGYESDLIRQNFFYALSHGLIKYNFEPKQKERFVKITSKGKFIIDYVFFDENIFYFLALDTPLNKEAIENSKLVRFFSNRKYYWENYSESCIITVLTFIRHILTMHNLEMKKLKASKYQYIDYFQMPSFFPSIIIKRLQSHIKTLSRFNDISRYERLINDIQGIF